MLHCRFRNGRAAIRDGELEHAIVGNVGLLCRTELERLGVALPDGIPIPDGNPFGDLLEKLDQIEAKRLGAAAVSPLLLP